MKTILTKLAFFTIVLFCISSCLKEVDYGYPKNVYFSKEGGEHTVIGNVNFSSAFVNDVGGIGESWTEINGEDTITYHMFNWLKIGYRDGYRISPTNELTIYAEPNTSGKSRKNTIRVYFWPTYSEIKVKQEK